MTEPTPENDWQVGADGEPAIRVLFADHDPISRAFLSTALRTAGQLRLVAVTDSRHPLSEEQLSQVDVAVVSAGPHQEQVLSQELSARGIRVLLIGIYWPRYRVQAALEAGAAGLIVKNAQTSELVAAIHAVSAGHLVLTPELLQLYTSPGDPTVAVQTAPPQELLLRSLTARELEVLELLAKGMATAEVARYLTVSPATVKSHVSHIITKLGTRNRIESVLLMQQVINARQGSDQRAPELLDFNG